MGKNPFSELLLDQIKDLVWAVDSDLLLVYANKSYLNLMKEVTGVEKEMNTPILVEGFGEGYIEKWRSYYHRALAGEFFEIEEHYLNPETNMMQYGHIGFSPIRDEGGEILTVACRSTDITTVIWQKDHASRLMDASLDVFCTIDEGGKFVFVSAVSKDHWGYHPEELIGKPFRDLIVEEDIEKTNQVAADILAGREIKSFSNRYRKKNGDIAYNLWSVRWDHESKLMYCVARDAKEKIEEEQRLKLLEKVINSTTDAILISEAEPLDEPGPVILYVNESFTKMTGYTAEEVIGKNPRLLQGPDSNREELKKLGEKLKRWEAAEITVLNYTKTGEPFWVNFAVSPVANEKGWFTHWISVQRDVTEKKKQEAEKEFLSQISLSFNNEVELISAANRLCENLYDFGKFDLIELWCPNMDQTQIKLMGHSSHNQDFYSQELMPTSFQKNEGLPGKVWEMGKQILWDEKQVEKYFIRKEGATYLWLQAIIGLPLSYNDKLVGVLLIGTKRDPDYLEQNSSVLSRLEKFIGSEINRKRLENDLNHLHESIPDIVCVADLQGRYLKINRSGCELLGYSEEEFLNRNYEEFVFPADKDISTQEFAKLSQGQSTYSFENRLVQKNGEICWLSWTANVDLQEGLIYATAKNITAEKKLRELNKVTSKMARIGSWEVDLQKNKIFWSDMVHQLHEIDPQNFEPDLAQSINFYREEFRPMVTEAVTQCIESGKPFDFEAVIVTATKNELWVRAIGNAEFANGKCIRIYGSFQDIHERKEADLRLLSLADNLPGVVFQFQFFPDGTSKFLNLSKGVENLYGIDAESIMQNNALIWDQVVAGGDFDKVQASITESVTTLTNWHVIYRNKLPNGKIIWLEGWGTPRRLPDGSTIWDSIVLEITDLKETEQLLASASKLARVGSWEIDLVNNSLFWSDITHEIHETAHDFKPQLSEAINFYREDFRPIVTDSLNQCIQLGTPSDLEAVIVTANKNELWVRVIGKAEFENGECIRIFGSFQDIHERKQSQLELLKAKELAEENEYKMKQAQKLAHLGSWYYDVVNQVSQWSEETYNIWGLNPAINSVDLIDHQKLIHPKDWERFNAVIKNATEKGIPYKMDLELVRPDGSYKTVNTIGDPIFDENNKVIAFKGTTQDITDRIIIENELRSAIKKAEESDARFKSYTQQSPIGIYTTDINGDCIYANKTWLDMAGMQLEDALGKGWINALHPENVEYVTENWYKSIESNGEWNYEYRFVNSNKDIIWVNGSAKKLFNDKNELIGYLGSNVNITERKKAEVELLAINQKLNIQTKELQRSNEELEQFAFITSHDLQEPLRMITSFMEQLKRKYGNQLDDKALQYIDFASDGAKRMKQIILDLLLYSRANKPTEQIEEVNLNDIVLKYTQLRRKLISEKNASILFDELPVLQTNRAPLTQVLHCLLDNGLRYVKETVPPCIEIHAKEKEKVWEFAVKDNGIGIDEKFYDKIFIIFQRLHNRKDFDGTGIGLSIAKRSVEFLGGEIWLESRVGEGSTFYFTISKNN